MSYKGNYHRDFRDGHDHAYRTQDHDDHGHYSHHHDSYGNHSKNDLAGYLDQEGFRC